MQALHPFGPPRSVRTSRGAPPAAAPGVRLPAAGAPQNKKELAPAFWASEEVCVSPADVSGRGEPRKGCAGGREVEAALVRAVQRAPGSGWEKTWLAAASSALLPLVPAALNTTKLL